MLYHPQIHLEYALLHLKLHIFYISKLGGEGSSKSSKNIIGWKHTMVTPFGAFLGLIL
jgi:hypothetical protein